MRRLLLALGFSLLCGPALAANCTSPITGNDAGGTSRNIGTVLDASNNCLGKNTIWDYSAGANGAGVDTSHGVLVDPASAALWNTTWAGGTLGAMANYGTSPGAVLVPGVNASVTASALPTGAATSALQTTGNTALSTINTTLGSPMQASGGSVTANAGTNLNTSALATHADIVTNSATSAHTCSTGGASVQGCLGQIDDDVKGAIAAGSNIIGKVGIDQTTPGTTNAVYANQVSPYPVTAVPITASNTGTTAATTATLTNVSGHTTYICWYSVRANATAATTVTDTITGIITGTRSSALWVAPLASGLGVDEMIFSPCVPASAVSTSIAVVSGAPGSGGTVTVSAGGYSL